MLVFRDKDTKNIGHLQEGLGRRLMNWERSDSQIAHPLRADTQQPPFTTCNQAK